MGSDEGSEMKGVTIEAKIVGPSSRFTWGVVVKARLPGEYLVEEHHLDAQYPSVQGRVLARVGEETEIVIGVFTKPEGKAPLLLGLGDDDFSRVCPAVCH